MTIDHTLRAPLEDRDLVEFPLDVSTMSDMLNEAMLFVDALPQAIAGAEAEAVTMAIDGMDPTDGATLGSYDWLLMETGVNALPPSCSMSSDTFENAKSKSLGQAGALPLPNRMSNTEPTDPTLASVSATEESTDESDAKVPPPIRKPPNKRKTMRDELIALRKQAHDLYEHLQALQMKTLHQGGRQGSDLTGKASPWEMISRRQLKQRWRVEHENGKLRRRIEDQRTVLRAFHRILSKSGPIARSIPHSDIIWNKVFPDLDTNGRKTMVTDLQASLVGMYEGVDDIFADPHFASTTYPFRKIDFCSDALFGPTVELTDVSVYPFHYEDVAAVAWRPHATVRDGFFEHVISSTTDEMLGAFGASIDLTRVSGVVRATMMQRRVVEANRVVFICSTLLDPSAIGQFTVPNAQLRYIKWVVVEPADPSQTVPFGPQSHATVVKTLEIVRIESEVDIDGHPDAAKFTNAVVDSSHFQLDSRHQYIENVLLEQARARQASL